MTALLFSLVLFFTNCAPNAAVCQNNESMVLEVQEYLLDGNHNILTNDSTILQTGWYYVVDVPNSYKRQLSKSNETYYIDPMPIVTAKNIARLEIYETNVSKIPGLAMHLDKEGAEKWSIATRRTEIYGMKLAFVLDNRLLQTSVVYSQITSGATAINSGNYSRQELEDIKTTIESEKIANH